MLTCAGRLYLWHLMNMIYDICAICGPAFELCGICAICGPGLEICVSHA
jgi:hypothetical protein